MSTSSEKVETLFAAAVALQTESQRSDYLSQACPDPALRREVEALLAKQPNPVPGMAVKTIRITPVDGHSSDTHDHYLGETLDGKYLLERLLGQGGMGAVYLATHLGTGRYVAVKLITPEFMRKDEFVERFKREARAAGRLRHPNIVDVTDFGFARVGTETIAYLVMEYLDGCTLREVLAEEDRLPLNWGVDILEQVCSAVQEAHRQGIVHRDLKPDNIWLEPNRLGGYRAKVLDFGIAKLTEENNAPPGMVIAVPTTPAPVEAAVAIIEDRPPVLPGNGGTSQAAQLTRMGAILGTPLYMSPEQCRGETLDARSDVYSLGIIAYQMFSGTTPFTGEGMSVIRDHLKNQPKSLHDQNRKVPRRISLVIMSALAKSPRTRPQSAMAFANALRANADGLSVLYRRAFALYCEYFPQIIKLSLIAHIPVILVTIMAIGFQLKNSDNSVLSVVPLGLLKAVATFVTGSTISGVVTIIVTQIAVEPLEAVKLGPAFAILRQRWRPFLKTSVLATVRIIGGFILLVIPGIVMTVRYAVWAPVVLMEGLEKMPALKRSRVLTSRSSKTIIIAMLIQYLLPAMVEKQIRLLIGLDATAPKNGAQTKAFEQLAALSSIVLLPLLSIVPALLYLKMRQFGGETLTDVMAQIKPKGTRTKWEQRMRERTPQPRL